MARRTAIAKISTPRLFGVVARQRLFARLDENRGRPLVWLDGPPGAGKTTLVASYLEERRLPVLWYQVEASDADPATLFHYLTLAAQALPGVPSALPRLAPEHLTDLPAFARIYFRELFTALPENCVLVLDNYQEAPSDAALHQVLFNAVAQVPPGSSIHCVSRMEAPASFAPLAASGVMFPLRWELLRLTLDETREICAARGVRDDWLVRALHQQSEGWAAGVTLMLERLGHGGADTAVLPTDTRESVFNYFASLLFDQAPESTQRTLLAVAFLPHVTAAVARELSGCHDAGDVLEQLYRRHLFTDRRPAAEPVYQFHALFREFLQSCARKTLDAVEMHDLKMRSAQALECIGDIGEAIDLRMSAQDWTAAARLLLQAAKPLLASGRRETLERWMQLLPAELLDCTPWLLHWLGLAQTQTAPDRGIDTLHRSLERFRAQGDVHGEVLTLAALLNASFLGFLGLARMEAWLDQLLARMERLAVALPPQAELRVWGVLCSALFWLRPWHPWTKEAAGRVEALLLYNDDPTTAVAAAASALATASMSGDFERGDRIIVTTRALVECPSASPTESAWWLVHAGFLRFFEARYEEGLDFMGAASRIAELNGMRMTFVMALFHRCAIEFRALGWSVASATLEDMEATGARYPMAAAMLHLLQARRANFYGRHREAADFARLAEAATAKTGSRYQEMLFGLIEAEIYATAGLIHQAKPLLATSRALIEQTPAFDCWRAALVLVEAWLALQENQCERALDRLKESMSLAREGQRKHYLRHFECAMPPLFSLALQSGIEVDLVSRIIVMFRLKPPHAAPHSWPWPIRIRTLGRFDVTLNDAALEFSRKVPKKTLALLKALVAYGGHEVSEQVLCDALWGDEEADAARQALAITIVRLRKLLGNNEVVFQQGGKVSLDRSLCWVDAWRFEERAEGAINGEALFKTLDLYAGTFLAEDEGEPWSVPARERLRGKFIHLLATHGRSLEGSGRVNDAIRLYQRGVDADPIVEAFHQGLMRCYRSLHRHTEAISVYRRMRQTLSVVLSVSPSTESQELYREVMQECEQRGSDAVDAVVSLTQARRLKA